MKQDDMAKVLNITTRQYRNYELGAQEPKLESLALIADLFGITLDELVGRIPPKRPLIHSEEILKEIPNPD